MKIYVATGLERAAEARALAEELERHGYTITYKWYEHGSVQREGPARIAEVAALEVNGVLAADVFVALLPGGRGTHTELGLAIAEAHHRTKRVLVVGPLAGKDGLECAFYRAPVVERLTSVHDLLQALLFEREVGPMTTETHLTQVDILTCADREQCEVVACLTHERDELRDALNGAMLNRGKGKDYAGRLLTVMAKHYGVSSACEIMRKERDEARAECKRLRGIIDSQSKELAELRERQAWIITKLRSDQTYKGNEDGRSETAEIQGRLHVLVSSHETLHRMLPEVDAMSRELAEVVTERDRLRVSLSVINDCVPETERMEDVPTSDEAPVLSAQQIAAFVAEQREKLAWKFGDCYTALNIIDSQAKELDEQTAMWHRQEEIVKAQDEELAELSVLRKEHAAAVAYRKLKYYPNRDDGIIADASHKMLDDILAGRGPTP